MGHLLGYARVSTLLQDQALQTDALTAAGVARTYTDHVSSRVERRPQLEALLERVDAGDTIVVWRLDRLARSLRELIDLVNGLGERNVGLRSLTEQIDTATPGGRLLFHIMGSIAEFERDLIRERTVAGLQAARARGRHGGRRSVMTPDKVKAARKMRDAGDMSADAIAAALGVSRATLYRHLSATTGKG